MYDGKVTPPYTALSYCWGPPGANFTTTDGNLSEHKTGIDFKSLPEALKDAVTITQALGIPYLWIDAICIVQGNASDWEEQCSQMDKVYSLAAVTLIAASSSTCRESFLEPKRGQELIYPAHFDGLDQSYMVSYYGHCRRPGENISQPKPFLLSPTHSEGHSESAYFWKDLTQCAWARRGWTFQESFVSPRKIVFGHGDVHFVRHGQAFSRTGGTAADPWIPFEQLTTATQLRGAWMKVMDQYSRFTPASFTVPSDLLPALSGLASRFGNLLPEDVYLAGHWSGDLHISLMWKKSHTILSPRVEYQSDSVQQGLEYLEIVPSWSCMSRGVVTFLVKAEEEGTIKSELVSIRDFEGTNTGGVPHSFMACSRITLEGYVLDLTGFSWMPGGSICYGMGPGDDGTVITIDESECRRFVLYMQAMISDVRASTGNWVLQFHLDYLWQREGGEQPWDDAEVRSRYLEPLNRSFLLLLGSRTHGEGYGLVIIPTKSPEQERQFRRVGCFKTVSTGSVEFLRGIMNREKVTLV